MTRLGPWALAVVVALGLLRLAPAHVALAYFDATTSVTGSFTTGVWTGVRYLHDRPSPPTGPTTAHVGLPWDLVAPTATTLVDYDSDCDGQPGRGIAVGDGLADETDPCRVVSWTSDPYLAPTQVTGTLLVHVWAAKTKPGGTVPALIAYLVEVGPSSASVLGTAQLPIASTSLDAVDLAIPVDATLATGDRLELRLVATGKNRDVILAYDTTAYPATITLP